jgi:hypothetical protein
MSCVTATDSICVAQGEDYADTLAAVDDAGAALDVTGWAWAGGLYPAQNGGPAPGGALLLDFAPLVTLTSATAAPQWAILAPRAALAAALPAPGTYWLELFFDDAAGHRKRAATTFNYEPSGGG